MDVATFARHATDPHGANAFHATAAAIDAVADAVRAADQATTHFAIHTPASTAYSAIATAVRTTVQPTTSLAIHTAAVYTATTQDAATALAVQSYITGVATVGSAFAGTSPVTFAGVDTPHDRRKRRGRPPSHRRRHSPPAEASAAPARSLQQLCR